MKTEKTNLEKALTTFLGFIHRNGANEEEREAVIRTIVLVRKYWPPYKKQGS